MTTVTTTTMMKQPYNHRSSNMLCRLASLVVLLLTASLLPSCNAQPATDLVDVDAAAAAKKNRPNKGGRKNDLSLAESYDSVSVVRANPAAPQAGDYFVWNNKVWSFDEKDHVPTAVIGTSRGQCVLLQDNNTGAGHCSFTLTFEKVTNKRGVKDDSDVEEEEEQEDEEEETPQVSKLMVMGDVDSLEWDFKQTLAIVGGTGKHEAAAGVVDVVAKSGFLLYEIFLD